MTPLAKTTRRRAKTAALSWIWGPVLLGLTGCPAPDPSDRQGDAHIAPDVVDSAVSPDGAPDAQDAMVTTDCPTVSDGTPLGWLSDPQVDEVSGLAASRAQAGVLWVHNDSGDGGRVYALDTAGVLRGIYNLTGAYAWDYEDIAVEADQLYVADIGDNSRIREYVTIYRVAEPTVDLAASPAVAADLDGVDALELVYPDGPHDAETLIVDPQDGDLLIITKEEDGDALVYRAPGDADPSARTTLEQVAALPLGGATLPGGEKATGGDASPDGDAVILRTSTSAFLWWRPAGGALWEAFSGTACPLALLEEPNGEAMGFDHAGTGYFTLSEGTAQPLHYYGLGSEGLTLRYNQPPRSGGEGTDRPNAN